MSALIALPAIPKSGAALIASPNGALRERVLHRIHGRCRPVYEVAGGADALAKLEKGEWEVLFLDRKLPDLDAEELLIVIRKRFPGIRVILLDSETGSPGEIEDEGRYPDPARPRSAGTAKAVTSLAETVPALPGMIGSSEAMQRVYRMVRLVAARSTTVLIAGPTGAGKELVARAVHSLSPRSSRAFVVVNCAAIPEALLESELFGFTRGSFTGAVQSQSGRIAAAHGGTLFLDEVSELPLGMQAKLLRFLEQKEIQRLGTCDVTRVDVRVVAASNVDLGRRAARGEFRQDLFYRLAAFPIEVPPLAARREDIVPLAEHFLACMSAALGGPVSRLTPEAIRTLEHHAWMGNVRELQHVMERASILAEDGGIIDSAHLYFSNCDSVTIGDALRSC
ncbi:MAG TPA: sigma-54 dependent transcriptional regulator [Candidatus Sulfotelmatobacter sp.]|nr:sigma-54 dependent transcriptional regulator [Candidatus Sulfotelmatobacter sp.]